MCDVVCDRDGWTAVWEADRLPHLETSVLAAEPLRLLAFVMTHNAHKVPHQWTNALFTVQRFVFFRRTSKLTLWEIILNVEVCRHAAKR